IFGRSVDPGLRRPTVWKRNRLSWLTWVQAPPAQPSGSAVWALGGWRFGNFGSWTSVMLSFQTCFHCDDESGWTLVMSGRKKIPPPHIDSANSPLAGAHVLPVSMTPMLSCSGSAACFPLPGMWATEISFGASGFEMSQIRAVGRKVCASTGLMGSVPSSRASAYTFRPTARIWDISDPEAPKLISVAHMPSNGKNPADPEHDNIGVMETGKTWAP